MSAIPGVLANLIIKPAEMPVFAMKYVIISGRNRTRTYDLLCVREAF